MPPPGNAAPSARMDHVGFTVADLDRSVEFYRSTLGFEPVVEAAAEGKEVEAAVGVEGASMRVALLRGSNMTIELIEYVRSAGRQDRRRVNDVGSAHVCVVVADIEASHAELSGRGALFVAPPSPPLGEDGTRIAFLLDPDGNYVELLQPGRPAPAAEGF